MKTLEIGYFDGFYVKLDQQIHLIKTFFFAQWLIYAFHLESKPKSAIYFFIAALFKQFIPYFLGRPSLNGGKKSNNVITNQRYGRFHQNIWVSLRARIIEIIFFLQRFWE